MIDICVVDVYPGDESGSIERIRDMVTETGLPSVAFMATAVPNEQSLDDRLQDWVHRFNLLQEGLKDLPVQVGILIQALIGHGDRNRIVGELPFQNVVGADGVACRESFCPLDTGFQAYTKQLIQTLAETAPAFFMIDDDFRIAHHEPATRGCMCPLHMDRFAQRLGTPISRENLVAQFGEEPSEIREQWEQLKEDSLVELARVIRDAIDAVDDTIPGTFCSVAFEVHLAPAIADTLAGNGHRPLVRLNNAIYLESGHKDFQRRIAQTFHQIAQFSDDTVVLTEPDTCPHNRYSLSVKSHLAHITATTLAGCRGGKYWFPKTDEESWQETAPFRRMLVNRRLFLDEVEKIRDRVSWTGPAVTGSMKEILRKPWEQQVPLDFLSDDWGWRIFGRMGIPFAVSDGTDTVASPRALCRTAPLAYTTEELTDFLSGSVLLDGEAAWHLCKMGLGEYLGVTAQPTSDACAYELMHLTPGSERTRELAVGMSGDGRYRLTPESDETLTASSFATGSPAAYTVVGPALTWHTNKLGGRVAVYAVSMNSPMDWVFFNSKRKTQLLETLTWLADGSPPVVVETDLDVYMLHGHDTTDDGVEYTCLFNLNPDTVENVCITLPGKKVTNVEMLTMNGQWEPVSFTSKGSAIRCDADARTMEPCILRLALQVARTHSSTP